MTWLSLYSTSDASEDATLSGRVMERDSAMSCVRVRVSVRETFSEKKWRMYLDRIDFENSPCLCLVRPSRSFSRFDGWCLHDAFGFGRSGSAFLRLRFVSNLFRFSVRSVSVVSLQFQ